MSRVPILGLNMGLGPGLFEGKVPLCKVPSADHWPGVCLLAGSLLISLLTLGLLCKGHAMDMGLLGNTLPVLIPHLVARCYCIDKPIPLTSCP